MEKSPTVPNLAALRRNAGLSQEALAEAVGVSTMSISNYEIGRRSPKLATIKAIAERLGVKLDDLMAA